MVSSWIPLGWDVHFNSEDFLTRRDILLALVLNPKYGQLRVGSELLSTMMTSLKSVSKDNLGPIINVEIFSSADSISKLAHLTVIHSYTTLALTASIPKLGSPAARKKGVAEVKLALGVKIRKLGAALVTRMNDLEAGKEFEALDYEAMQQVSGCLSCRFSRRPRSGTHCGSDYPPKHHSGLVRCNFAAARGENTTCEPGCLGGGG